MRRWLHVGVFPLVGVALVVGGCAAPGAGTRAPQASGGPVVRSIAADAPLGMRSGALDPTTGQLVIVTRAFDDETLRLTRISPDTSREVAATMTIPLRYPLKGWSRASVSVATDGTIWIAGGRDVIHLSAAGDVLLVTRVPPVPAGRDDLEVGRVAALQIVAKGWPVVAVVGDIHLRDLGPSGWTAGPRVAPIDASTRLVLQPSGSVAVRLLPKMNSTRASGQSAVVYTEAFDPAHLDRTWWVRDRPQASTVAAMWAGYTDGAGQHYVAMLPLRTSTWSGQSGIAGVRGKPIPTGTFRLDPGIQALVPVPGGVVVLTMASGNAPSAYPVAWDVAGT